VTEEGASPRVEGAGSATRQWLRLETRGDLLTETVELQTAVTRLVGTRADLLRYGGITVQQDVEVRPTLDRRAQPTSALAVGVCGQLSTSCPHPSLALVLAH
jgi:hypothetical protein